MFAKCKEKKFGIYCINFSRIFYNWRCSIKISVAILLKSFLSQKLLIIVLY